MTSSILEKAQSLADEIARSNELAELRSTEKVMMADEDAQRVIAEFQQAQQQLLEAQQLGQEPSEADQAKVEMIEDKVESHPLIAPYLVAQDRFTEMLDNVNAILAQAIAGESIDDCSSGCGGCSGC